MSRLGGGRARVRDSSRRAMARRRTVWPKTAAPASASSWRRHGAAASWPTEDAATGLEPATSASRISTIGLAVAAASRSGGLAVAGFTCGVGSRRVHGRRSIAGRGAAALAASAEAGPGAALAVLTARPCSAGIAVPRSETLSAGLRPRGRPSSPGSGVRRPGFALVPGIGGGGLGGLTAFEALAASGADRGARRAAEEDRDRVAFGARGRASAGRRCPRTLPRPPSRGAPQEAHAASSRRRFGMAALSSLFLRGRRTLPAHADLLAHIRRRRRPASAAARRAARPTRTARRRAPEALVEQRGGLDRAVRRGGLPEDHGDDALPVARGDRDEIEARGADEPRLHALDAGIAPDEAVGVVA